MPQDFGQKEGGLCWGLFFERWWRGGSGKVDSGGGEVTGGNLSLSLLVVFALVAEHGAYRLSDESTNFSGAKPSKDHEKEYDLCSRSTSPPKNSANHQSTGG